MVKFVPWGRSFQRFPNSENPFSTLFDSYGGIVEILVIVVIQPDTGPLLWSSAMPYFIFKCSPAGVYLKLESFLEAYVK